MKCYNLAVNKITRFVLSKNYLIINEDIRLNKDILLRYYEDNKNMQLINLFENVQFKNHT